MIKTLEQLGVDITGKNVADEQLLTAIAIANAQGYRLEQHDGVILWGGKTIPISKSFDFSGLTILTDSDSAVAGNPMFLLEAEDRAVWLNSADITTLNSTYKSELVAGVGLITMPRLTAFRDAMITFYASNEHIDRNGTNSITYQESIIVGYGGEVLTSLKYNWSSLTITDVRIIPRPKSRLELILPHLEITDNTEDFVFLDTYRGMIDLHGLTVNESTPTSAGVRRLVRLNNGYDITLSQMNLQASPNISEGSYGLSVNDVVRLKLDGLIGHDGWGLMGSNYVKELFALNCHLNRFDCHWGAADWTLIGNRTKYYGVSVSGAGRMIIRDHTHHLRKTVGAYPYAMTTRADYGHEWQGIWDIEGLHLIMPAGASGTAMKGFTAGNVDYDSGRNTVLPVHIRMKNVFAYLHGQDIDVYSVDLLDAKYTSAGASAGRSLAQPTTVDADTPVLIDAGGSATATAYRSVV